MNHHLTPDLFSQYQSHFWNHTITLEVEDEEGAMCLDNISLLVDSRPTIEILSP